MEAECPLTEIKKNFGFPPQPEEKKEKFNYRVLGRKNKKDGVKIAGELFWAESSFGLSFHLFVD
jgi:hypothetical protein